MTCNCKCCCGCCCDGSTGSQTLEPSCEAPKVFHGKGTICDVCCDLGEIREDIDSEEDCPGTWVVNGRCTGCTPPPCCCYWSCDYVAELVWPDIENPEDIPDVGDAMIAAGWALVFGMWRKTIKGEENCNDPGVAADKEQDLESEVDAIVADLGGYSSVDIDLGSSGPGCIDGVTQQGCEETYLGTFHAGKTCLENPCCSGSCDEENPCKNTLSTGWDCDCVDGACAPAENPLP